MMSLLPIHDHTDAWYSCSLFAGSAQAHVSSLDCSAIVPPILSRSVRSARSPLRTLPCFEQKRSRRPSRSGLLNPYTAAKSP